LNDLTRWVRLHLGNGSFGGRPVIDADALHQTWWPYHRTQPVNPPTARAAFYGLGWNVNYDEQGRLRIGHSGAFFLGAATNVSLIPVENLGIITLTNAQPIGVAEAVNVAFLDIAQNGKPTVDWLTFLQNAFSHLGDEDKPAVDYTKPPSVVTPARSLGAYAGTYQNSYYGPLAVAATGGSLSMALGPSGRPTVFPLTHYTGDTFTFQTVGENANGLAGAIFHANGGTIGSVTLDFYDRTGLGTFVR
jgi:CubicO group peptidase (beta-lactamase class C family)